MRRIFFCILILALILSFGCVSRTYTQTFERDGTSTVIQSTDATGLVQSVSTNLGKTEEEIRENISYEMEVACARSINAGIECEKTGDLSANRIRTFDYGSFYAFKQHSSFPFVKYEVTIRSIPESSFGFSEDRLKDDIPLTNKKVAKSILKRYGDGYQLFYAVVLPGAIQSAIAGGYNASIEGSKATFNLNELADAPAPLVIKSEEFDVPGVLLFLVILVLFGSTYYFIGVYGVGALPFVTPLKKEEPLFEEPKPVKGKRRYT